METSSRRLGELQVPTPPKLFLQAPFSCRGCRDTLVPLRPPHLSPWGREHPGLGKPISACTPHLPWLFSPAPAAGSATQLSTRALYARPCRQSPVLASSSTATA